VAEGNMQYSVSQRRKLLDSYHVTRFDHLQGLQGLWHKQL